MEKRQHTWHTTILVCFQELSEIEVWINPCHPDCLSGAYDTTLIESFKEHIKITANGILFQLAARFPLRSFFPI